MKKIHKMLQSSLCFLAWWHYQLNSSSYYIVEWKDENNDLLIPLTEILFESIIYLSIKILKKFPSC